MQSVYFVLRLETSIALNRLSRWSNVMERDDVELSNCNLPLFLLIRSGCRSAFAPIVSSVNCGDNFIILLQLSS